MSLFNRPAWAQVASNTNSEETARDIFNHTGRTLSTLASDDRQRKRSKGAKPEKKVSAAAAPEVEPAAEPIEKEADSLVKPESAVKRRRITAEESNNLLKKMGLAPNMPDAEKSEESQVKASKDTSLIDQQDSRVSMPILASTEDSASHTIIDILPDQNEEERIVTARDVNRKAAQPVKPPAEDEDEDSDPEIAELQRQARLRRAKVASTTIADSSRAESSGSIPSEILKDPDPDPDPAINLFITSTIPNTNPLLVYRRLSQRLQDVKDAWCDRQGFTSGFGKNVFLIHRMHRVYNATTCRSLGLSVDETGRVVMRGAEKEEGAQNVHLEAVTEAIYAKMKVDRSHREQMRLEGVAVDERDKGSKNGTGLSSGEPNSNFAGGIGSGNGDGMRREHDNETGNEDRRENIRIVLRTHKQADLKLKVQPTTTFAKITAACRSTWLIPVENEIVLEFDGDRLPPDGQVHETEIEDMTVIDVHVR